MNADPTCNYRPSLGGQVIRLVPLCSTRLPSTGGGPPYGFVLEGISYNSSLPQKQSLMECFTKVQPVSYSFSNSTGLIKVTSLLVICFKKKYQKLDFFHHFRILPYYHRDLSAEFFDPPKNPTSF